MEAMIMRRVQNYLIAILALLILVIILKPIITRKNEDFAIAMLKTIRTVQVEYKKAKGIYGTLNDLIQSGLLTSNLSDGKSLGYRFNIIEGGNKYKVTAVQKKYAEKNYFGTGGL